MLTWEHFKDKDGDQTWFYDWPEIERVALIKTGIRRCGRHPKGCRVHDQGGYPITREGKGHSLYAASA